MVRDLDLEMIRPGTQRSQFYRDRRPDSTPRSPNQFTSESLSRVDVVKPVTYNRISGVFGLYVTGLEGIEHEHSPHQRRHGRQRQRHRTRDRWWTVRPLRPY